MTLNCVHIFIVTGSFLYWYVMRPASQRYFIHSKLYWAYLRSLSSRYLPTYYGRSTAVIWLSSRCCTCQRLLIRLTIQRSRLRRLRTSYDFGDSVFAWFASYLDGRTQHVRCGSSNSHPAGVKFGVPQDSVLGLILFLLYTADLLRLIELHNLCPHPYADDTQIYGFCRPGATAQLQDHMTACVDDVALWMQSNRLQLNTAKTEGLWCSSARRLHQIPSVPLTIGSNDIIPVSTVRDLGIYIDSDISMRSDIAKTVSICFAALRQIRSIKRSISRPEQSCSHWLYRWC